MEKHDPSSKLITAIQPRSPASEAFRSIRSNLHFATARGQVKSIMFASARAAEGKSTVVANVAVAMAQSAKRVLVVDCDLRRPTQHLIFGSRQLPGLTSLLVDGLDVDEVVLPTKIPNLWLMPSGTIPPNPSELLDSDHMRDLWPILRQNYDQVLVDSPPVLVVTDAAVLASQVDGVVMVIEAGETRGELARDAKESLLHAGGKVIGAVLNNVKGTGSSGSYYYYYRYYGRQEEKTS
ncbi:MAG: CpsD/CapB family tyrosine-protein kinase [Bacillota bacterium]